MPSEIAHPFHVGPDGRIATITDPDAQVRQHVLALVNTEPGDRLMLPGYGVASSQFLFEDATDEIPIRLGTLVENAFASWESGVGLISTTIPENLIPEREPVERMDIQYVRKGAPESSSGTRANYAVISASGTVKEVIRG